MLSGNSAPQFAGFGQRLTDLTSGRICPTCATPVIEGVAFGNSCCSALVPDQYLSNGGGSADLRIEPLRALLPKNHQAIDYVFKHLAISLLEKITPMTKQESALALLRQASFCYFAANALSSLAQAGLIEMKDAFSSVMSNGFDGSLLGSLKEKYSAIKSADLSKASAEALSMKSKATFAMLLALQLKLSYPNLFY